MTRLARLAFGVILAVASLIAVLLFVASADGMPAFLGGGYGAHAFHEDAGPGDAGSEDAGNFSVIVADGSVVTPIDAGSITAWMINNAKVWDENFFSFTSNGTKLWVFSTGQGQSFYATSSDGLNFTAHNGTQTVGSITFPNVALAHSDANHTTWDQDYAGLGFCWPDQDGGMYCLEHQENHQYFGSNNGDLLTIGMTTFPVPGATTPLGIRSATPIAQSETLIPDAGIGGGGGVFGIGLPAGYFQSGTYVYAVFMDYETHYLAQFWTHKIGIMRAPAANPAPGQWRKWCSGAWSSTDAAQQGSCEDDLVVPHPGGTSGGHAAFGTCCPSLSFFPQLLGGVWVVPFLGEDTLVGGTGNGVFYFTIADITAPAPSSPTFLFDLGDVGSFTPESCFSSATRPDTLTVLQAPDIYAAIFDGSPNEIPARRTAHMQ